MVTITKEKLNKETWTNIAITRGDGVTLVLPIYLNNNGTRTAYTPDPTDVFALQVREHPVKSATDVPALVFQGSVSVVANKLTWDISATNTTKDCGHYYWDCQITQSGSAPFTFYKGWFNITPEATLPSTP